MNGTTTLGLPIASSNGPNLSLSTIAKVRSSMTRYSLRKSASFCGVAHLPAHQRGDAVLRRHGGAVVPKEPWPQGDGGDKAVFALAPRLGHLTGSSALRSECMTTLRVFS